MADRSIQSFSEDSSDFPVAVKVEIIEDENWTIDLRPTSESAPPFNLVFPDDPDDKPASCPDCPNFTGTAKQLKNHAKIHTYKKVHECTDCGKYFRSTSELKRHRLSHNAEKSFGCDLCQKLFARPSSLREHHLKIHKGLKRPVNEQTKERKFVCIICKNTFLYKSLLDIHMRRHTNERPFACELCGKNYTQKEYLTRHMLYHSGVRPFKCDYCDKAFVERVNLRNHVSTHGTSKGRVAQGKSATMGSTTIQGK